MKKEKITTTKIVLFSVLVFCAILELIVVFAWISWEKDDASGMAGVIASQAAIVIGFYEWKAKAENLSKYSNNKETEQIEDE